MSVDFTRWARLSFEYPVATMKSIADADSAIDASAISKKRHFSFTLGLAFPSDKFRIALDSARLNWSMIK